MDGHCYYPYGKTNILRKYLFACSTSNNKESIITSNDMHQSICDTLFMTTTCCSEVHDQKLQTACHTINVTHNIHRNTITYEAMCSILIVGCKVG